jgi:hypothetical protein
MTKLGTLLLLAVMALASQPTVVLADEVPTFDVRATCGAEAQADPAAGAVASCLADEQRARETLAREWAQFAPESRTTCVQTEAGIPGVRSYVELLTCLQLAKDAKNLPKE